jgi:hypothetical protein
VTTACPAPLEASTWPSLVGAENLADIVELSSAIVGGSGLTDSCVRERKTKTWF